MHMCDASVRAQKQPVWVGEASHRHCYRFTNPDRATSNPPLVVQSGSSYWCLVWTASSYFQPLVLVQPSRIIDGKSILASVWQPLYIWRLFLFSCHFYWLNKQGLDTVTVPNRAFSSPFPGPQTSQCWFKFNLHGITVWQPGATTKKVLLSVTIDKAFFFLVIV